MSVKTIYVPGAFSLVLCHYHLLFFVSRWIGGNFTEEDIATSFVFLLNKMCRLC